MRRTQGYPQVYPSLWISRGPAGVDLSTAGEPGGSSPPQTAAARPQGTTPPGVTRPSDARAARYLCCAGRPSRRSRSVVAVRASIGRSGAAATFRLLAKSDPTAARLVLLQAAALTRHSNEGAEPSRARR